MGGGMAFRYVMSAMVVLGLTNFSVAIAQSDGAIYGTPADINDFADDPDKARQMQSLWTHFMGAFAEMAIVGNPWSNDYDAPRENYVDLSTVTSQQLDAAKIQPITWSAFPNKVNWYFHTSQFNPYQLDSALLYPLADEGRLNPDDPVLQRWITLQDAGQSGTPVQDNLDAVLTNFPDINSPDLSSFAPLEIPTEICPLVNWNQPKKDADGQDNWVKFNANISGPRGWKDEYNEWVVTRNDAGDIIKITFTSENPEYWFSLWEVDPDKVLELYQQLVQPAVTMDDLILKDKDGDPVLNAAGLPSYNPLNKWNYGNIAHADGGGAVHLTSPPNTVGAEIYLGGAATMIRDLSANEYSPANNLCASLYGGAFRNSDPNIGMQANQVTRNLGLRLTLTNPIALYMQYPDFSNYAAPESRAGLDVSQFFTVVRGRVAAEAGVNYDQILHAIFEVPAELGFTVSDITIGGVPILYGSQMAETFNQALAATAFPDMPIVDATKFPAVASAENPNGWAQPLVTSDVFWAVQDNPDISAATIPLLPLVTSPGSTLTHMAMEVISGGPKADIVYGQLVGGSQAENFVPEPGITVIVNGSRTLGGSVPGHPDLYETIVYDLTIDIAEDVAPGSYGVQVTNPGNTPQVPTPANLIIVAKP